MTAKKITGLRTKKAADTRGPKAGSAMANQSVKLAPEDKAQIADEAEARSPTLVGKKVLRTTRDERAERLKLESEIAAIARATGAVSINAKKPVGHLARGVDGHNSPHAVKAMADNKRAAKASAAPEPKAVKAKPAKVAQAAPKAGGADRVYSVTKKEDTSKEGSYRRYMISIIRAHKTTGPAKAAHAASGQFAKERLNFKWAHDNGYIVLADLK